MITIAPKEGLEVSIAVHDDELVPLAQLEAISDGIAQEDMCTVSPEQLSGSYATIGAFALQSSGERSLIGFIRQPERYYFRIEDEEVVCVTEMASLWVHPDYRRHHIGGLLVKTATDISDVVGFTPIAVCNPDGKKVFERVGYEPIGTMPNNRTVELYRPHVNPYERKMWANGFGGQVICAIAGLPRFASAHIEIPQTA